MKVNISGRGIIPIVRKVAPVYNVNIDKLTCYKLLGSNNLIIYRSSDGMRITRANLDTMFIEKMLSDEPVAVETPVVSKTKPVKNAPKKDIKKEEIKEEPAPAVEETVEEDDSTVEETEDTTIEEDTVAEEKPQYTNKKKKKYRNNG